MKNIPIILLFLVSMPTFVAAHYGSASSSRGWSQPYHANNAIHAAQQHAYNNNLRIQTANYASAQRHIENNRSAWNSQRSNNAVAIPVAGGGMTPTQGNLSVTTMPLCVCLGGDCQDGCNWCFKPCCNCYSRTCCSPCDLLLTLSICVTIGVAFALIVQALSKCSFCS